MTARGQALWQNIYAPHDVKLGAKLGSYHPDFIGVFHILGSEFLGSK